MNEVELAGMYDLHIHSAPDLVARCIDDIEAARQAAEAGMAGILLKSHYTLTSDRAQIAERIVPNIKVYGALTLNESVGGLNVSAVETALQLGAREIFMPTISAANHLRGEKRQGGISILDEQSNLAPLLKEILALVSDYKAILGTGHLSGDEIKILVKTAKKEGLKKIVITHPELPLVNLSLDEQYHLSGNGVYFERCYASTFPLSGNVPLEQIARDIKEIGASSTLLTTDFGRADYPLPAEGLQAFIANLKKVGIEEKEIELMTKENPRRLLEG